MRDWEKYENQIFEELRKKFPKTNILPNQKVIGQYSKINRQIDILVQSSEIGKELFIVIDCKNFAKNIDIKDVECFIGMVEDVKAHLGIMITNKGYSKSAKNRATNNNRDIRLDIVEYSKLPNYDWWDECELCSLSNDYAREIYWNGQVELFNKNKSVTVDLGQCSYCGEQYISCCSCGHIIHMDEYAKAVDCLCGHIFSFNSEYDRKGMVEIEPTLLKHKSQNKKSF